MKNKSQNMRMRGRMVNLDYFLSYLPLVDEGRTIDADAMMNVYSKRAALCASSVLRDTFESSCASDIILNISRIINLY